jgi:hypothetical protein
LRRDLLIDKAAARKAAEALDHSLTSLDRRAESLRSRLEVFGKKNSLKKFLGLPKILRTQSRPRLFRYFPDQLTSTDTAGVAGDPA